MQKVCWNTTAATLTEECVKQNPPRNARYKGMHDAIAELVRTTLLIVGALFPIVNTPQNIPIFLTLTAGLSRESRSVLARKVAVNGFALLIVSVLIGTHILAFFGISLP